MKLETKIFWINSWQEFKGNLNLKSILIYSVMIILALLSVAHVNAYDSQDNVTIGTLSLPENGQFNFSFKLVENETLYFNLTNKSEELEFDFPAEHTLNGTDSYNFLVNWSIDETIFPSNKTLLGEFIVTNSLNLNNHSIGLKYFIEKEEEGVFSINSSSSLDVVNGKYVRNISILEFPDNGTFTFNIEGSPGERFNVSGCEDDRFLACENSSFVLNSGGQFTLDIPYNMPFTPLGTYNESFSLVSDIRNNTIDVIFNVVQPDIFLVPKSIEACQVENPTPADRFQCEEELAEYRLEVVRALNEYYTRINTDNICEQFVKTEYVVGDSVDEEFLKENRELRNENKVLSNDNSRLENRLNTCQADVSSLENDLNNTITQKNQEIKEAELQGRERSVEVFKSSEEGKKQELSNQSFWMKLFVFLGFLLCIGLAVFRWVNENIFANTVRINYIVVGIVGAFFFITWLALLVVG